MSVSTFFFGSLGATLLHNWLQKSTINKFVQMIFESCVAGVFVTPIALIIIGFTVGFDVFNTGFIIESAANCFVITALVSIMMNIFNHKNHSNAPVKLQSRLNNSKKGNLISISVKGHYVEVLTDKGLTSLLMRFGDAIDETNGLDGIQIHRSHWVSKLHIESVIKLDKRYFVRMLDGRELPISRSHIATVKSAGLL